MINLFWSIPHRFFHNAIAWPELNFIFNIGWNNSHIIDFETHHLVEKGEKIHPDKKD